MKLFYRCFLFACFLFAFSCKKTETIYIEKKEPSANISGTWQILGDSNQLQNSYYIFPAENQQIFYYLHKGVNDINYKSEGFCEIFLNQIRLDYNLYNLKLMNDTLIIYGSNQYKIKCIKLNNPIVTLANWIPKLKIEKAIPMMSYKYKYRGTSFGVDNRYLYFNGDNLDENVLNSNIYKYNYLTNILEDSMPVDYRDCGVTFGNGKLYYYYYFANLYKVFTSNGLDKSTFREFSNFEISDVYNFFAGENDTLYIQQYNDIKAGTPTSDFATYKNYLPNNNRFLIGKRGPYFLTLDYTNNVFYLLKDNAKNEIVKKMQFENNYYFTNFAIYKQDVWASVYSYSTNACTFFKINLD